MEEYNEFRLALTELLVNLKGWNFDFDYRLTRREADVVKKAGELVKEMDNRMVSRGGFGESESDKNKVFGYLHVNNLPGGRIENGFLVCRVVDGELWYYGLYDLKDRADKAVAEIGNGIVVEV